MKTPKRVLIVGGTHGNEWTGIHIYKHYQDQLRSKFPTLKLDFIFANPEAYKKNCRFVDEDLNRAYQFINENRPHSYEHNRAKEILKEIQSEACLILDLHTTTSHMGNTVIVSHYNTLNLSLCAKLARAFPDCRIIGAPDPNKKYLASQSDHGLILEVGPVANGVVAPVPLESTLILIEFILMSMASPNFDSENTVELYEEALDIYYPKNQNNEINGYIHSEMQGKDFSLLEGEFPAFKTFQGETVKVKTTEKMYPIFVNEAAYYPQQLAFTLCKKRMLSF